jgi:hypothetical protein
VLLCDLHIVKTKLDENLWKLHESEAHQLQRARRIAVQRRDVKDLNVNLCTKEKHYGRWAA